MRFRIKDIFKTYSVSGSLSFCESRVLRNVEYYADFKTNGNFLMHIAIFLFYHLFSSFPEDNFMHGVLSTAYLFSLNRSATDT
jgi:hypothetical protein